MTQPHLSRIRLCVALGARLHFFCGLTGFSPFPFQMELKKCDQSLMEERNQRMRLTTTLQTSTSKIAELEDRLRRTETHAKDNKAALVTMISHVKNVERAVTLGQQDIMAKKEVQGQK